jgi:hypothetical protein
MRPRIRASKMAPRRILPERSRLTVRRTVAALRRSREALVGLEHELDDLLLRVRSPEGVLDGGASQRLAVAKDDAVAAMASLADVAQLFG